MRCVDCGKECGRVMSPNQPYCLFCCSCKDNKITVTNTGINIEVKNFSKKSKKRL